jgi:type VI protein secretion system component VasF
MTPLDDQGIGELIGSVRALEKRMEDYIRTFERSIDLMRSEQLVALAQIRDAVSSQLSDHKKEVTDQNKRIRALENWRNYLAGIQAALALAWAWFLAQLHGRK